MSELFGEAKQKELEHLLTMDNKNAPPWYGAHGAFFPVEMLFENPFRPHKSFLVINRKPLSEKITLEQETSLDVGVFHSVVNSGITIGQVFSFPPNAKIEATAYACGATFHSDPCSMTLVWRNQYLSVITGPGRVIVSSHKFHHFSGTYIMEMIAARRSST